MATKRKKVFDPTGSRVIGYIEVEEKKEKSFSEKIWENIESSIAPIGDKLYKYFAKWLHPLIRLIITGLFDFGDFLLWGVFVWSLFPPMRIWTEPITKTYGSVQTAVNISLWGKYGGIALTELALEVLKFPIPKILMRLVDLLPLGLFGAGMMMKKKDKDYPLWEKAKTFPGTLMQITLNALFIYLLIKLAVLTYTYWSFIWSVSWLLFMVPYYVIKLFFTFIKLIIKAFMLVK